MKGKGNLTFDKFTREDLKCKAVALYKEGKTQTVIASLLGVSQMTVSRYLQEEYALWKEENMSNIEELRRAQCERLETIIQNSMRSYEENENLKDYRIAMEAMKSQRALMGLNTPVKHEVATTSTQIHQVVMYLPDNKRTNETIDILMTEIPSLPAGEDEQDPEDTENWD